VKRLRKRPDRKRMLKLAEPWRPYRGIGARVLWHYYRTVKAGSAGGVG
jgi:DNA-3-methyladenine glycosylase II